MRKNQVISYLIDREVIDDLIDNWKFFLCKKRFLVVTAPLCEIIFERCPFVRQIKIFKTLHQAVL